MGVPRALPGGDPRAADRGAAAGPGDHRPADRRLPDRPERARAAGRRQHHDPRPGPARPAVPDVRGGRRARPGAAAPVPALGDHLRGAHVQLPDAVRDRRGVRDRVGDGGGAAARLAAGVAHARPLSADPRREARERPDGGEHGRRDGADGHDRARDPRRRRRHPVGVGQRRRDRDPDHARADRARAVLLRAAADRRPAPVPPARDGAHRALRDRRGRLPRRRGRGRDVPDRGHRRRLLRRAGDEPARAERGSADGPDRLLRRRRCSCPCSWSRSGSCSSRA